MTGTLRELEQLSRETHLPEAELIARALEAGIRQLRREQVLGRYVRGELNRAEAAERVGLHWVELADRQREAVEEDLAWALNP